MNNIKLFNQQVLHTNKLISILDKYPLAFDFSMMGTGKTYTSSFIGKNYKNVIVVCPVSIKSKWEYMKSYYNINITICISYCSLRSNTNSNTLFINADKSDIFNADKSDIFNVSELYKQYINDPDGTLLIFDEIQNIKNNNLQFKACKSLINEIIDIGFNIKNKSRCLLLSGSPIDKKEQIINIYKLINVMTNNELCVYIPSLNKTEWKGFKQIIEFIKKLDSNYASSLPVKTTNSSNNSARELLELSYNYFIGYVKNVLVSSMSPIINGISLIKRNGFYNVDDIESKLSIKKAVDNLFNVCDYNIITKTINIKKNISVISNIQRSLIAIENAKLTTLARITREKLNGSDSENWKVVICLNYIDNIKSLENALKEYNPLVIYGNVSKDKREEYRLLFQEPNNNYRILISNLACSSAGLDLDDKHGNFPRFCLINPNYSTIDLYQIGHRFHRADTKSNSTIHFVYTKVACEIHVLNSLAKKSEIMKEIVKEQSENGIEFPCDFNYFIEADNLDTEFNLDNLI
jgi:hypothetical protein